MIRFRHWSFAVLAAMLLTSCADRFPDYHYKMTVYAGGKAYSSVRSVEVNETSSIVDSGGSTIKRRVEGEAVIIDLGGASPVYALLSKPDNADYAQFVMGMALAPHLPKPEPTAKSDAGQAIDAYKEQSSRQDSFGDAATTLQALVKIKGPRDLPRTIPSSYMDKGQRIQRPIQAWPMFVAFDDPKDPKTVREVSPDSIGVSRITIEITDEPLTTGIEARLGWLDKHRNVTFAGNRFAKDNSIADQLVAGSFSIKVK
jgi:hypothetical protein